MAERALVLIDIQNDYFPGGNMALEGPEAASANAARALAQFRSRGEPVLHVRHLWCGPARRFSFPGLKAPRSTPACGPARARLSCRRISRIAFVVPSSIRC